MNREDCAPKSDQSAGVAGLNIGECPQESEKMSKKARK